MPLKRPIRRRRKPASQRWWMGRRLTAYGKQALSVLVLAGTLFLREGQPVVPVSKREEEQPPVWAADVLQVQDGGSQSVGGIPIPSAPLNGQQRPPCSGVEEYAINGGCWVLAGHAPCSSVVYVHGGRCYLPSKASQRPPTSVTE